METKHDVIVTNKRGVQFKFTVYRKFTIIRGDSATGKTTLFQMVSDAASSRMSGVTVSCDVPVRPLNESGYLRELQEESGRIYVIDEDFGPLKSMEFAKAATISDNCFLIITRESISAIPYSYKEIMSLIHIYRDSARNRMSGGRNLWNRPGSQQLSAWKQRGGDSGQLK